MTSRPAGFNDFIKDLSKRTGVEIDADEAWADCERRVTKCSRDGCDQPGVHMVTMTGFGAEQKSWWCGLHHQEMMDYFKRQSDEQRARREAQS